MTLPPHPGVPPGMATLADYEAAARAHLEPEIWRHIQEGSGAERSLAENRASFARWGFLPRALADLRGGSTELSLFGRRHAAPLLLAPMAYQRLAHPEGELAVVRAATALETGMVVSTLASVTIEEIAAAGRDAAAALDRPVPPLWFQLYLQPDRQDSLALVRRAEAAGYEAIVLTVDAAIKPAGLTLPAEVDAVNLAGMRRIRQTATPGTSGIILGTALADAAPRWADLEWLRSETRLPVLLKGMLLGEDAARAVDLGADGLIVSNHGGRVLDGLPSALDMLDAVSAATGGRVPLLMDGGVRTGSDVVKALALGASAVLVGRPQMHALAVAGMAGVAHAIHMLRTELEATMAQLGCARLDAIGPDRLWRFEQHARQAMLSPDRPDVTWPDLT
ncbi:4-hydroxymandelate oxidase [Novosphingobium chloroacetimidivorans]|uniref:4-hydroxymandelate oxidase n=1 Tax=Novosphingobium chloroacetimidivorans TaxID=1428314 RepID=A0A7W7K7L1_9SPHN|nr:alpha-hydroxy acid oxidase [Novosphingobium chloroacetimidivorans]MBB4857697.1 4-hydroxymandelate oxidase [Novosphingobium chloroacetimidivorans]